MANVDLGTMEIDHVERISNSDIIELVAMIDLGFQQLSRCPSATSTDVHAADVAIIQGWIARFKQHFEHFASLPELYMPKAHPKPKLLPVPPTVKIVQNPAVQNLMYQMSHLRTELLHCEDAEKLNGFHKQQAKVVFEPWIAKFELFVAEIEANLTNPDRTWLPDADLQEPGVNPGEPR